MSNPQPSPERSTDSILLKSATKINPIINSLRNEPVAENGMPNRFITSDGFKLFYRSFIPISVDKIPKIVICIHGLHSPGEKFVLMADKFIQEGWGTIAIDLRGHGLSWEKDSDRGDIPNWRYWIRDMDEFFRFISKTYPDSKLYIVAESMGGAVAVHIAMHQPSALQAIVLIAPALKPIRQVKLSMALQTLTHGVAKNRQVIRSHGKGNLTTNTETYQLYQLNDPLRLTSVSPRYYYQVLAMLDTIKRYKFDKFYPTCLFYGDEDHLIDFKGMKTFIHRLNTKDKALHYIPYGFHELLTDLNAVRYGLYKKTVQWIQLH